jgi:hypothetical protein
MKNLIIVLIMLSLGLVSCKKWETEVPRSPSDSDNTEEFNWTGCDPMPVEELEKIPVEGWNNVYDYKFRMHLNGSQIDPNPLIKEEFSIPHVGPGGKLIYSNVANDATYTIDKIYAGWVYYTIRSEKGHKLKYNIARKEGNEYIWFLKYGLNHDDGINNIITFETY